MSGWALNHFNSALDEKVGPVDVESPVTETAWNSLQEAINVTCKESIGYARRVNFDWFDKNDVTLTRLIDEKRAALNAFRADPNSIDTAVNCILITGIYKRNV